MTPDLVGRASEIAVVESLLAGIAVGGGSLLVLGDPGIGKSALVEAAAQRAVDGGIRVLACAGVPSEAQYSFAGLHQLLRPVVGEADSLPRGQRDALLTALGMADGPAPAIPLVGLAALELLAGVAEGAPLLVVAEDAHCLDLSTCEVLAFVSRRLGADAIGLLVTGRVSELGNNPLAMAGLRELRLGPLDPRSSRSLGGVRFPRDVSQVIQVPGTSQSVAGSAASPGAGRGAPHRLELRHLRYFVAVADAGTFTHAAERMFIAQPTLSQQIRRLEEMVGTPLLQRRREGVRLTEAGAVLLEESRSVLSLVDHGVSQTRQAAGLGRPRLRVVIPPGLPEALAVAAATGLRSAAAAGVDVVWLETAFDAEFSPIRQRRADAGLGWLTASPGALPAPLEAMGLGEFEPEVWLPSGHPAAPRGGIGLDELAGLEVIHGPRRASPATYDRWLEVLRVVDPRFEFTDPPVRHSLPMVLAFAATASRPAAVLTGPAAIAGPPPGVTRLSRPAGTGDMTRVSITGYPLTATAALVWHGDLPGPLQQILVDTADAAAPPPASAPPAAARPGQQYAAELISGGIPAGALC